MPIKPPTGLKLIPSPGPNNRLGIFLLIIIKELVTKNQTPTKDPWKNIGSKIVGFWISLHVLR